MPIQLVFLVGRVRAVTERTSPNRSEFGRQHPLAPEIFYKSLGFGQGSALCHQSAFAGHRPHPLYDEERK
jgi:hypothetical protein